MQHRNHCVAQTSLAHTYGNMTCFIVDYIKNLFPANYFKTVHVSSTIAYKQFSIFQNTNKEFLKKAPPMLVVRPRIEIDSTDTFLYDTYLTTRTNDQYMENSFTNLQPFIIDKDKGFEVKYLLNRLKMYFDVTIITETQMDQLNQAHFLKNRLRSNMSYFLSTYLESYIPRELMLLLGEDAGIPVYDGKMNVKTFLDYVNGHSLFPVSYKMKNSTGNDEFFRYYPVNIDTIFSGIGIDDGNKRGMTSELFTVTFTLSTEFNATGLYYYFTEKRTIIDDFIFGVKPGKNSSDIIPLYTAENLYTSKYGEGWTVFTSPMYQVDGNIQRGEWDKMDITPILNHSLMKCIRYNHDNGVPLDTFLRIEVKKDGRTMAPTIEYDIDFSELDDPKAIDPSITLITKNCNINSTYRLIINVNTRYINELLTDIMSLNEEK